MRLGVELRHLYMTSEQPVRLTQTTCLLKKKKPSDMMRKEEWLVLYLEHKQTVRSNVVLFGDVSIHSLTSNQACWVNLKGNLCRFKGEILLSPTGSCLVQLYEAG